MAANTVLRQYTYKNNNNVEPYVILDQECWMIRWGIDQTMCLITSLVLAGGIGRGARQPCLGILLLQAFQHVLLTIELTD